MAGRQKKNYYISVAGVMGTGKTTAAKLLAEKFGFRLFEENFAENVFLPLYYKDPKRWALPTQLFYLREKIYQLEMVRKFLLCTGVVQDSPIYQDHFIYAKARLLLGYMTRDEYTLYQNFFDKLYRDLPVPDLILQLEASLPVIQNRIRNRARDYEKEIDTEYIKLLSRLQKEWISENHHLKIISVNTDNLDFSRNTAHQKILVEMVRSKIGN